MSRKAKTRSLSKSLKEGISPDWCQMIEEIVSQTRTRDATYL